MSRAQQAPPSFLRPQGSLRAMTAPAAIIASFAQPAARLAMGDAVGGAMGGFEALLAMLTQSQQGGAEGQATETATEARTPAESGDLAGLLAAANPTVWLTQTMSQATAEDGAAPVTCDLPQTRGATIDAASTNTEQPQADLTGLEALMRGQASETVDPAILERARPTKGWTDAQWGPGPAPVASEPAAPAEPVAAAAVAVQAVVQPVAEDQVQTRAETVAAPVVVTPPAEPRAPVATRRAASATEGKAARVEGGDATTAPVKIAEADKATEALADENAPVEVAALEAEAADAPAHNTDAAVQTLTARLETLAAGATAFAAQVRGAPETVAKLAAGILDKLEGKTTRFDLQLDPHGLGTVDVSVEIASDGKLTAQLGFDSALGLSELRGRAQELRAALEQAGFSLADNALTFDFSGERRQQQTADSQADRSDQAGKAFARAMGALDEELAAVPTRYQARRGLDLLI